MMVYFVYIARCVDGTYYCGTAKELGKRIALHNTGKGAKYTRSRVPVKLVYSERKRNRVSAMRREAEIKSLTRKEKEELALASASKR